MAGLYDYLNPDADPELNPAPASLDDYLAVRQEAQTPAPQSPATVQSLQKYMDMAGKASADEEAGLGTLQQYIQDYQAKPRDVDFTALAGWADSLKPGGKTLEVAKGLQPESVDAKNEKLMKLQDMLQQRKGALSGRQLGAAKIGLEQQLAQDRALQAQQLQADKFKQAQEIARQKMEQEKIRTDAYRESIASREKIARMGLAAAQAAKADAQDRADDRQKAGLEQKDEKKVEDQMVKFESKAIDAVPLMENMSTVEDILGAPLEQYDPKTESINGKKVDLPGKSIPGIGRVFAPGSQGETLQAAMANIFNTTLKERSGAAVTDQELNRLKNEFAQGKFNTEGKMIEAMQRYKRILQKRMRQHEAAFKPEVRNLYRTQGGMTSEDFFPEPGAGKPPPGPKQHRDENTGILYQLNGDTWEPVSEGGN